MNFKASGSYSNPRVELRSARKLTSLFIDNWKGEELGQHCLIGNFIAKSACSDDREAGRAFPDLVSAYNKTYYPNSAYLLPDGICFKKSTCEKI